MLFIKQRIITSWRVQVPKSSMHSQHLQLKHLRATAPAHIETAAETLEPLICSISQVSFSMTHKINKTNNEEIKGTRTDLESGADLVEWNLIQSSWGKGRWRLWNQQVSQKSNEDWKQHIPNQHCEWTAFTLETSLCTAWSILEVFWLLAAIHCIAASLLAWCQAEDIKPHWAALLMQSGERAL